MDGAAQMGREIDKGEKTWFMTNWEYLNLPFASKIGKYLRRRKENTAGADKTDQEKQMSPDDREYGVISGEGILTDPSKSWDNLMVADVSAVAAALPATSLPPSRRVVASERVRSCRIAPLSDPRRCRLRRPLAVG